MLFPNLTKMNSIFSAVVTFSWKRWNISLAVNQNVKKHLPTSSDLNCRITSASSLFPAITATWKGSWFAKFCVVLSAPRKSKTLAHDSCERKKGTWDIEESYNTVTVSLICIQCCTDNHEQVFVYVRYLWRHIIMSVFNANTIHWIQQLHLHLLISTLNATATWIRCTKGLELCTTRFQANLTAQ